MQFDVDIMKMKPHGVGRDEQPIGNSLRAVTFDEFLEHLSLPVGESGE